jgi:murein DD-endopeptidase MepM/ murein hydrolase activator NlpD
MIKSKLLFNTSRKRSALLISILFLGVCTVAGAALITTAAEDQESFVQSKKIAVPLALPKLALVQPEDDDKSRFVMSTSTTDSDTIADMLKRLNVEDSDAFSFLVKNPTAKKLMHLGAGKPIVAEVDAEGSLVKLEATYTDENQDTRVLQVRRDNDTFQATEAGAALERQVEMRSGSIGASFFKSTDAANTPAVVSTKMANIFGTQLDFANDVKKGDNFNVVYESFWRNGVLVKIGNILAAEINASGVARKVVLFGLPGQIAAYYTPDGVAVQNAFLKSPLGFSRVTSGFAMRTHPISGDWKQHKGIDFSAPMGTPIHATASGRVEFAGSKNGYGNMVVIEHGKDVTTAYGHLMHFSNGVRAGEQVKQGQVIGFVGMTGWSTGPHVHYEFRVNNEPRNPVLAANTLDALNDHSLMRFRQVSSDMTHRLALLRRA